MRELWSRDMEISVDLFKLYENLQTLHGILFFVVKVRLYLFVRLCLCVSVRVVWVIFTLFTGRS